METRHEYINVYIYTYICIPMVHKKQCMYDVCL